ncbi:O-antigen/teichoic acid export membrane protein [Labrenzia sp. EL_13]|nr:O-antigen/teichoic acid export membrane protein [Labrenzia sp. EL_13]
MANDRMEPSVVSQSGEASDGRDVPSRGGLRKDLAVGTLIFAAAGFFLKIVGIIALAILGRVLTPADLAIGAYCLFATGLCAAIIIRPFDIGLIRLQDVTEEHLSTVFTMRVIFGAFCALVLYFLAEPVAAWTNADELARVLKVISLCPLVNGFFNPAYVLYAKKLRFGPEALQDIVPRLTFNAVAISVAIYWQSYWALVAGYVLSELSRSLISYIRTPAVSGLEFSEWRYFYKLTRWIIAVNLIGYVNRRVDQILIAPGLGLTTAGLYRVGRDLSELSTVHLVRPINRVIFPGLASIRDDPEKLASAYLKLQVMTLGIVTPVGVFLSVGASDLLRVVMGPQWLDAATVVTFLAPIWAIMTINAGIKALVFIENETWKLFTRDLIALSITLPAILVGIQLGGFLGVILASLFANCVYIFMTLMIAARSTGTSLFSPFIRAWRYLLSSVLMAAGLVLFKSQVPETTAETPFLHSCIMIACYLSIGGAIYACTSLLTWFATGKPDGLERHLISLIRMAPKKLTKQGEGN